MTRLIEARTRLEAWIEATEYLLASEAEFNMVLSILEPLDEGPSADTARQLADRFFEEEGTFSTHTVAETIFPGWEYRRRGLRGVFDTYPNQDYPAFRHRWGTYAHRMVRRTTPKGKVINPLEIMINKMKRENQRHGSFKSVYELSVADVESEIPIYDPAIDSRLTRGAPCLSHLSFKLDKKRVHLTAIYRSHDYRYKVLGNMLGLARLQACVAHEVGASVGNMVIHSTYAYLEQGKGKRRLASMTAEMRQLVDLSGLINRSE